jgi:hypothetical protein
VSEIHSAEHNNTLPGESGRRRTWPVGVPPMWLTRPRRPASTGAMAQPQERHDGPPPRLLNVWRALTGVVLLALAWAGLVLVAMFGAMVLPLLRSQHLTPRLALYALGAIGVCWVGVIALACLVTGAFCLSLAISRANWD